jgi:hypothetical protein
MLRPAESPLIPTFSPHAAVRGEKRNERRCLTLWIGKERPRTARRGESRARVGVVIHFADDAGDAGF